MSLRTKSGTSFRIWFAVMAGFAALLLLMGAMPAAAQDKNGGKGGKGVEQQKPSGNGISSVNELQTITSYPLTITVADDTRMSISRRDEKQFYNDDAEGVFLWVNVGGQTKVFGPEHVDAGNTVNPYQFVSNAKFGTGTAADPFIVVTVVRVPGTPLQLTHRVSYVAGAEYAVPNFVVEQIGGTTPMTVTLFHAADLYTGGSDRGYGFRDEASNSVGSYYTRTNGTALYQQFVPSPAYQAPSAYMEADYSTIWDAIGDTTGPGAGFDNTIISDTLHDAGAGLQWNLNVGASGAVTVGDTDLFSPLSGLCGSFNDVDESTNPFYYDVAYLACHGMVSGYADGTFRPFANTTRGQLAKIIVIGEGWPIDTTGGPHFSDVPANNPFYGYIETARAHNVISGYGDGTFRWGADVTRGQIAKVVVNAEGWAINTTGGPHFVDVQPTNTFYSFIETAYNRGIISGYNLPNNTKEFRWGNNATRGQISKIVHGALLQ